MADESAPPAGTGQTVPGATGGEVARSGEEAARSGEEAALAGQAVPRSGEPVPRGELRASHEDRDRVVEVLRVAAGDGRLTAEELDERVGAALTARTYNELAALVADLPSAPGAPVSVPVSAAPAAKPREVVRIDCQQGNTDRRGHWTVPQRLDVRIEAGNVTLDFTSAEITSPTLQIDVDIHHGNLKLVTRPGIVVNTDDLAIHGSNVKVAAMPPSDVPVMLRIDIAGQLHHSNIQVRPPRPPKPPRRTFWQWLTRQPRPSALPPGAVPGALPPGRI